MIIVSRLWLSPHCEKLMEVSGVQWQLFTAISDTLWVNFPKVVWDASYCHTFFGIKYNNYIQSLVVSFLHNFISNQHVHGTLYLCTLLLLCKLCGISLFASEMVGESYQMWRSIFSNFHLWTHIVANIQGIKRCFYKLSTHNNSVHESINHNLIKSSCYKEGN